MNQELRQKIINRVEFMKKGIPATRIARACGFNVACYRGHDQQKSRVPDDFQYVLRQLVKEGKIQEHQSALNQDPLYYPKGYPLPKTKSVLPPIGDRRIEEFSKTKDSLKVAASTRRTFDEVTEALWQSLDHFREQGKPFHAIDLIRHAGLTCHSCLDKRPALRAAIQEAIAVQGRPPRERSKLPEFITGRSKYSA